MADFLVVLAILFITPALVTNIAKDGLVRLCQHCECRRMFWFFPKGIHSMTGRRKEYECRRCTATWQRERLLAQQRQIYYKQLAASSKEIEALFKEFPDL